MAMQFQYKARAIAAQHKVSISESLVILVQHEDIYMLISTKSIMALQLIQKNKKTQHIPGWSTVIIRNKVILSLC